MRLDNYLLETIKDQNGESYTRSAIANFIKNGMVLVNGKTVKCGYEVKQTDKLEINIKPIETKAVPEDIPLDVVYEDNYLLIVNKPAGMVVHAGAGVTGG
ncbi:MAG: S4 domain-containing protein, partial [Firmicutes bacterium]|nr:S4 domain-containing protein [Bacillota bacterium]